MGELLGIGAVAEAVERSPATLRYLERRGLLPLAPRLVGSDRRVYRPEDVAEIRRILAERAGRHSEADDGPPEAA